MKKTHPNLIFLQYVSLVVFTLISLPGCSPTNEAHIIKPTAEPTQTPTIINPESRNSAESPDTRPTPASQPAINNDWADLPELPTAEPAPQSHPVPEPTPTPGQPDTSVPHAIFPSLPMPNPIWSAGILNGSPSSGGAEFSHDEYGPSDQTDPVLHITDPKDLPAFLLPQQKVVIHLPGFPPALYTVHFANTGGSDKTREKLKEKDQRRLIVRWNDHLLWRRWLAPIHSICSAVVPPQNVSETTNQLILENWGTLPLPLDSVWISLYSRGEYPFYVAMMQGEWLNQDESKWIRTVVLELSPASGDFNLSTFPKRIPQAPPQTPVELSMRWKEALARYHSLIQSDPKAAEALQPWMHDFSQAVSRGMMPAVSLLPPDHPNGSKGIALIMYLFGDLVHTWFLGGSSTDKLWEEQLQSLAPNAKVVSRDPDNPTDQPWIRYQSASYDFQKQFYQERQRKAFFEGDLSESEFQKRRHFLLITHVNFMAYMWNQQCFNSFVLHRWVTGNLMDNDYPVVVHGGHPGGPFFPAGNDSPGLMWEYVKTIFRFGGPDFRKGLANLTGTENQPELLGTTWAVADNGRDSVQVVVNSFPLLHGREVLLELPLPWDGPTSVLHHHVESYWGPPKESPPETTSTKLTIEGEMIPLDKEGTKGSWVKIPFTLQGHHMFEFRKEGSTENRPLTAPAQIGAAELKDVDHLFEISKFAPPPWWSRMPMGGPSSISWNQSGNVEMDVNVPASKTTVPDWAVFKDIHGAIPEEVKAVTPLRDTSTRFHFGEQPGKLAQVVRAGYSVPNTAQGETMGLWLKAEPPPGFQKKFNAFSAIPKTRFYMGNLPYRQLIEIEYGSWYFITSKAEWWVQPASRYDPALVFWPAEPEEMNPIIEVNAFEVYQIKFEGVEAEKCLGFLQQDNMGNIQVLVLGVPGKPASWRQRLPFLVDEKSFHHVKDRELLTTADTPEEDPPDYVPHQIHVLEESKILEIDIGRMPAPPSPSHLALIEKLFPLLRNEISSRKVGVFLLETGGPEHD